MTDIFSPGLFEIQEEFFFLSSLCGRTCEEEEEFLFFPSRHELQAPFAYLSSSLLIDSETWHLSPEMLITHNLENIIETQEK